VLPALADAEAITRGDCAAPATGTDLRHCSFAGRSMPEIDLHAAILDGVDLSNARLAGCKLVGASLKHADLKWAGLD
jgi:uncharacterized protein YjbI with pentapeptide repeats